MVLSNATQLESPIDRKRSKAYYRSIVSVLIILSGVSSMPGRKSIIRNFDRILAWPMFSFALMTLALFAVLIYLGDLEQEGTIVRYSLWGLAILYPLFWVETVIHICIGSRFLKQHVWFCLFPLTRIGCRDHLNGTQVWLPRMGWSDISKSFERKLSRKFSIPMIAVALLVLPLIGMEYFYQDTVAKSEGWQLVISISEAFIWASFTFEFVLMVMIVRAKVAYARKHWIDLAVILLPMLAFMRMLRLSSALRLNQISRTAKVFRLRGLAMRLWRAFVALEIIEMLIYRNPELRLERLEQKFEMKMEEIAFLRVDIQRLKERVAKIQAAEEAALEEESAS